MKFILVTVTISIEKAIVVTVPFQRPYIPPNGGEKSEAYISAAANHRHPLYIIAIS